MRRRRPWVLYLLVLYIGISFAYQAVGSVSFLVGYLNLRNQVKEPFQIDFANMKVTGMRDSAKAAGLRIGDTVETLNDQSCCERASWLRTRWYAHPDQVWQVDVRRTDGTRGTLAIPLDADTSTATLGEAIFLITLHIVLPTLLLLLGYWVALARPWDSNAWLVLILLSYPEAYITVSTYNWWPGPWLVLRLYWHLGLELTAPVALLLFGLFFEETRAKRSQSSLNRARRHQSAVRSARHPKGGGVSLLPGGAHPRPLRFPQRSAVDRRVPWLKWMVIAVFGCSALIELPAEHTGWYDHKFLPGFRAAEPFIDRILNWMYVLCIAIYWVAIFIQLRMAPSADARRRVRVLCAGSVVGFGSGLIAWGLLPRFGWDPAHVHWLAYSSAVLLLVFPLSLAYVVVVQRAMDVRILIRMGTRYILARTTLMLLELAIAAFFIAHFIVPLLVRRQNEALGIVLLALISGVVLRTLIAKRNPAERVRQWVDRSFFREAYDTELVLSELAQKARRITDPSLLIDTISRRISEVLHIDQCAVFLRSGETFQLQHAFGSTSGGTLVLTESAAPVQHLARTNSPAVIYSEDPEPWLVEAHQPVRDALESMRAEVLLPFPGREKLMGVMVLGPKRSEEAYSPADLRLLASVGAQTGLGLEVNELASSLALEATQRERMQREIEIAREVQERLFPQQIPSISGADLAGHCRPVLGVGGDYYDMIALDDGRLALAIGDISGKGIAAALLMASLRASLRGMIDDSSNDLARMMHKLNRRVYESSSANRYATFFFAIYDPAHRELCYVNCGHNPPFVVRSCCDVLRLEAGGPVIGLLPKIDYSAESIPINSGDLFVGYTDGISEAMTRDDEEWGEDRMLEAALAARNCCSQQILRAIFQSADTFTAGAPQHDDMTLLVMKLG